MLHLKNHSWSFANLYSNFSSTTSQFQLSCKGSIGSLAKMQPSKGRRKIKSCVWFFRLDHNQISISITYTMGSYFNIKDQTLPVVASSLPQTWQGEHWCHWVSLRSALFLCLHFHIFPSVFECLKSLQGAKLPFS